MVKSLFTVFMILLLQTAAQAQTLEPVPDPISTPGAPGGINLATCTLLQAQIAEKQALLNQTNFLLADQANSELFPLLMLAKAGLEVELFMLRMNYYLICGGAVPQPQICIDAHAKVQALYAEINFYRGQREIASEAYQNALNNGAVGYQLEALGVALATANQNLRNSLDKLEAFRWPAECGAMPANQGIPGM